MSPLEKIFLRAKADGECTILPSTTQPWRYPRASIGGVIDNADRWVYRLMKGAIPQGMEVCHTCDNPRCINPAHLWLGTHKENHKDKAQKSRSNVPAGEESPSSRLTKEEAEQVLKLRAAGHTYKQISKAIGKLNTAAVWKICTGKSWMSAEDPLGGRTTGRRKQVPTPRSPRAAS